MNTTLRLLLILLFTTTIAGCGTFDVGVVGTPTAVQDAGTQLQATESSTATVTPEPTATPSPTPTVALDATPPVGLLYETQNGLWRMEPDGEGVQIFDTSDARLSPDSEYALYQASQTPDQQNLWIASRHTGERRPLIAAEDRQSCCGRWWPARPNTVIASSWPAGISRGMGGDILVGFLTAVDAETGKHRVLDDTHDTHGAAVPSPDGRLIAYGSGRVGWLYNWADDRVEVFDPAEYDLPEDFTVERVVRPAWGPDGDTIAWYLHGTRDGTNTLALGVFDLDSDDATVIHPYTPFGTDGWPPAPRFSPDGNQVVFVAWDQNEEGIGVWVAGVNSTTAEPLLTGEGFHEVNVVWHPYGEYLAVSRAGDEDRPAATWIFDADTWERQKLDMPARDAIVVDWQISGANK